MRLELQRAAWQEAFDRDGEVDWRRLFDEYQSAFDWPMIYFWDKVVDAYPQAAGEGASH